MVSCISFWTALHQAAQSVVGATRCIAGREQGKLVAMNYEREAARLINLRASEILLLLAQTK